MKEIIINLQNMDNEALWSSVDSSTILIVRREVYSNLKFSSVKFMNRMRDLVYEYSVINKGTDWVISFKLK